MEEIDKDKLEFMADKFPQLENYAMAVIQSARSGGLSQIASDISSLETLMMDTFDWIFCHHCGLFNKGENFRAKGGDGLELCPDCGWEVE